MFWSSSYCQALAQCTTEFNTRLSIVGNHVDYKSISILVIQRKGMSVLCKRITFSKPDIMMVAYKFLILYLDILLHRWKQPSFKLCLLHVICQSIKLVENYIDLHTQIFV